MTYWFWLQRATAKQLTVCAVAAAFLSASLVFGDIVVARFHVGDFVAGIACLGALFYGLLAFRAWQRG